MYKLSASTSKNGDKGYYKDFKPTEVKSLKELGALMLTHSLCSQIFSAKEFPNKKGDYPAPYRKTTDTVVDTGSIIYFDIDNASPVDSKIQCNNPVKLKQITKAFKAMGWGCVITPSRSSTKKWQKFHIGAFTSNPVPNYKTAKKEYRQMYANVASELKLNLDKAMQSAIQNLTPALDKKILKIVDGHPIDFSSLTNDGLGGFAETIHGHSTVCGAGWETKIIKKKKFKAVQDVTIGSRCDCPKGKIHSDGIGKGYAFVNNSGGITCNGCGVNYHWKTDKERWTEETSLGGEKVTKDTGGNGCTSESGLDTDLDGKKYGFYMCGNNFYAQAGGKIYENLTMTSLRVHWKTYAQPGKKDVIEDYITIVDDVKHIIDFMGTSKIGVKGGNTLYITTNPFDAWNAKGKVDETIIADYRDTVMDGKIDDILNIISGSIIYGEAKLNKLLITGASNKGKTLIAELLGFVEMSASEFYNVMSQNKKWSKAKSQALMASGLLLADDVKERMPDGIKNMKDTISIDIMNVGAVFHPMKMLLVTSTTDSLLSMADDEIRNRFLQIHIGGDTTVTGCETYRSNPKKFQEHTTRWLRQKLMKAFENPISIEAFRDLQDLLMVDEDNGFEELLEIADAKVKADILEHCEGTIVNVNNPTVFKKGKVYFTRHKSDIKKLVREVLAKVFEGEHIDMSKHISILTDKYVSRARGRQKIKGVSVPNLHEILIDTK